MAGKKFGHIEYDMNNEIFYSKESLIPLNGIKSDFFIVKNAEFKNGLLVEQ
jgi:hypothetical protein